MNRIGKNISLLLCLLALTGCSGRELPKYQVAPTAKIWQTETVAAAEMERGPMAVETGNVGKWGRDHGTRQDDQAVLNAEIIGVSLVETTLGSDQDTMDESQIIEVAKARAQEELGREKVSADSPKSVLYFEANREYLIETRVLARINEDVTDQSVLTLDLGFPQAMMVDEFSTIACSVDAPQYYHEAGYTVTTALYDLELEYVQNSFALSKDGDLSTRFIDDQLAFYADSEGMMHLFFDVDLPNTVAAKEYIVSYRVRASLPDGQESELALRADSPVQLEATGVVVGNELSNDAAGNDTDEQGSTSVELEDDTAALLAALEWCLRDDYSGSETITAAVGDQVYIAAKAILPDWAVEHAAKNGLIIEWDSTAIKTGSYMRQVRLRLKSCPANYGGAAIVYEITLDKAKRDQLMLGSIVTDPITFWRETGQGSCQLIMTRDQHMAIHHDLTVDADDTVHNITQLSLEGEAASLLGNEFYVVCGMGVRQVDQQD